MERVLDDLTFGRELAVIGAKDSLQDAARAWAMPRD